MKAGLLDGSWSVVTGWRRGYRLTEAGSLALADVRTDRREFACVVGAVLEGLPWPRPNPA